MFKSKCFGRSLIPCHYFKIFFRMAPFKFNVCAKKNKWYLKFTLKKLRWSLINDSSLSLKIMQHNHGQPPETPVDFQVVTWTCCTATTQTCYLMRPTVVLMIAAMDSIVLLLCCTLLRHFCFCTDIVEMSHGCWVSFFLLWQVKLSVSLNRTGV